MLEQLHNQQQALNRQILDLQRSLEEAVQALSRSGSADSAELMQFARFQSVVNRRQQALGAEAAKLDVRIAQQRARCAEADRAEKLLLRLKEKKLSEWNMALSREVEAAASESHLAKWSREQRDRSLS